MQSSSITTSYFFSTHLNSFAHAHAHDIDNDNGDDYIIHMPRNTRAMNSSNRPVCTVALDRTFDRISEVEIPFDFPSGSARIVGSCNGLLCLAGIGGRNISDYAIYLWNPSIRKFKRLPDLMTDLAGSLVRMLSTMSSGRSFVLRRRIGGSVACDIFQR